MTEKELNEQQTEEQAQPEEETDASAEETTDQTTEEESQSEEDPVDEAAEWKDKYLRLFAEFDNVQKRNARERIELFKNASEELITAMLPVLDDFDRAIAELEANGSTTELEGVKLIHNKLYSLLEQKGLKWMDSMGEKFDVELHEAITEAPAPNKKQKGKVIDVIEKGYSLNEKIIRYAKVVVGK
jgi:molecular chaperone GrpE